ncbi:gluconokinase [Marinomonas pollencensis]|uniref:Gluconokinase n=1 Tax=Marinomonas pollencensis TaxID=491954 RepID=A0A3E0DJ30_9GAMM|nr:gluconokinase [Marinomonas pollencensis]REG82623.1 gluconokinase [Marinomonas pollencensis]
MIKKVIVLGVSGSGKSSIGQRLADQLGYPFFDGDDYHSEANVKKMAAGTPLNDDDRMGWLETLNQLLVEHDTAVIACSGLKPEYRQILRNNIDQLAMVYLKGDIETIWQRHQKRDGHYFNGRSMLESQFATLVEPTSDEAIIVDINQDVDAVYHQALAQLQA